MIREAIQVTLHQSNVNCKIRRQMIQRANLNTVHPHTWRLLKFMTKCQIVPQTVASQRHHLRMPNAAYLQTVPQTLCSKRLYQMRLTAARLNLRKKLQQNFMEPLLRILSQLPKICPPLDQKNQRRTWASLPNRKLRVKIHLPFLICHVFQQPGMVPVGKPLMGFCTDIRKRRSALSVSAMEPHSHRLSLCCMLEAQMYRSL